MRISKLDHLVLVTSDLSRCVSFYRDLLHMEVEEKDGKKIYTQAPQEIIGVEEEPVPISGIWKITSFNGETRHFNKGEIFPEGEGERTQKALLGPQMGLTIWELVKGDHDEPLRRKPIW